MCLYVSEEEAREGTGSPGAGITGGCEPPNVGARNWTRVLDKSSTSSLSTISPALDFILKISL